MNYFILTYVIYLLASIALTVWVAKVLFKNGRIFLVDIFHGNSELADSVNKLLVVGFYLVNIGYMGLALKEYGSIASMQVVVEVLSYKVGWIILILGGMHFLNLVIFFKLRNRAKRENAFTINA
ncbi:hypothetical protein DIU31_003595 [Mucilaginibacter rubeus]|uniref:Integral membrane protein n=1 Tax=Mucilaginibacter rubeus TaxID=2027860 RepID=A0AAE6MGK4_9SPHI|nr:MULTISPECIES: hypothetical protein [Mucilaginibacter]QEM02645.1 hypothetical protein DIU31_003595 [Mucilaginibacter rubeus]QEM15265.1 hypothetical protein DIU38_003630 [Mucilaginibacter gossypii]QTE42010.1 hypothetical protein J3L19_24175 [Mucilaginibacter rubeus]QTE48611.1 hypothetical protein J3L21_24150 [Mucilaginibacter rubeus]QTE59997.1 hypothetical protein J3L23_15780 [Mucilaginibacter rubeus]